MFGVSFDKIILTIVGSIMVLVPLLILVFIMYHKKNVEKAPQDSISDETSKQHSEDITPLE